MADVSVRPADPADAAAVARVQLAAWREAYADLLPSEALTLDPDDLAAAWGQSVTAPPSPRHRLLVAVEAGEVVGLAASEPAEVGAEVGAELTALLVEPRWSRRGHGSRLLAASVDLWREDGVDLGITWVFEADTVMGAFLESAGWGPDTLGRALETDASVVRQRRWHTAL